MTRRLVVSMLAASVTVPILGFVAAGGWAIATVEHLPEYLIVGRPTAIAFTVRQHGLTPMTGLSPVVQAKRGLTQIVVDAVPAERPGEYVAELSVPTAGDWTLTVMTAKPKPRLPLLPPAPMLSRSELLPIRAITTGEAAPPRPTDVDRGRALFVAKGCVGCHVHAMSGRPSTVPAGPELTGRSYPPEYLAKFLMNPPPPRGRGMIRMPELGLAPEEITALVAFVNARN